MYVEDLRVSGRSDTMLSVLLLYATVSAVWGVDLPASFKRCPVSAERDGRPSECLREAIYDAVVRLQSGDGELGVGALDPLHVRLITIDQGDASPVAIKLTFKDCYLRGISNLHVDSIVGKTSSPEGFYLKGTGHTPQLSLVGSYKVGGRVLILPIQGHGNSNLTLDNVKAEFTLKAEQQVKEGERYLRVTEMKLNIKSVSRLWIYLENLFNGDKALGDNMNAFLNQNWHDILTELRPAIDRAFGAVLEEYARQLLEAVPFDGIFVTS